MPAEVIVSIVGLLGIVVGAAVNGLLARRKNLVEIEKFKAETDKARAEAERARADLGSAEAAGLNRRSDIAFEAAEEFARSAAAILSRMCTDEGRLPQGAPTSPAISNLVCRKLDARLSALAARKDGSYTRYADDITISLPAFGRNKRLRPRPKGKPPLARPAEPASRSLLTLARKIIEEEGFRIQMKKKVRVQRPHQRQTATGLVVNQKVNLPRAVRRRIRAMQHHERLGRLDEAGLRRLRGLEALLGMVQKQR